MKLEDTLEPFRDMLSVERGLSKNTVSSYVLDVRNFLKWANQREMSKDLFREYVKTQGYTTGTIGRKIASVASWMSFCEMELQVRIALDLPKVSSSNLVPIVLSNSELERIIAYLLSKRDAFCVKMLAIIQLLYSTGVRVSELVSIRSNQWEDIQSQMKFSVVGKGNKERLVFVTKDAIRSVSMYLEQLKVKSDYLLCTRTGGKLNRQSVHRQLKLVAKRAKVASDKVFPHSFRHRLGSNLNQRGMNLAEIKEILGHSQIKTTLVYTHLEDEWIADSVRGAHPLGKLP